MKQILLKTWLMLVCLLALGGGNNAWAEDVTIASWTYSSRAANTEYAPTSNDASNSSARLKSECALSTAGTGGSSSAYYGSWTNNKAIYVTGLSMSSYTDKSISLTINLRHRNSGTAKFYYSTDGSSYPSTENVSKSITNTSSDYVITSIPNNVKSIKVVVNSSTAGNLWLGNVTIIGTPSGGGSTPTKLSKPTNLSTTNITATSADLSWDAVANASSYKLTVYDDEFNTLVDNQSVNATTYSVTGLTAETHYNWYVTAVGDGVNYSNSDASNDDEFTTLAQGGGDEPGGDEYTHDVLTNADFTATGTSYTDFSNVSKNTAVYAGNSAKSNGIQLRSNNSNSGIVSTTSGGKIKTVTVTWNSNCTSGRTIDVYGSNTAYTSAADLYNNTKQGTKLGSIVMGTSTSVTVTGNYSYVGVRSNSGSLNIDDIDFAWEEGGDTPEKDSPTLSFANPSYNATMGEPFAAPTLNNPQNVTVSYSSSFTEVATVDSETGAISLVNPGTTTITAAFEGNEDYSEASTSYQLVVSSKTVPSFTTQPVSATYEFNASAANLTVAATGNPAPTYQWYSNTTNSNSNGTVLTDETNASYKPSTATAGTFYYYCVATNSEGSAASSVATITVNEPSVASLPFAFDGGKSDIASKDGMSQSGLGTDYSSSPKLKFDNQGDNVIINFNEAAKKVTYTIKGNSTSGTYAFDVMESANGVEYTTLHHHTSITNDASYTDNLASTSRFVKFVYTTKANGNVALGKISIIAASYREEPNLAFDKATYKFIAGKDMQVTATSKAGSTGAITYALTEGETEAFLIDENTGYIVCKTAGTYTVTATIAETADYYSRSTTCTVNVLEPIVGNSIIVAETSGGCYAMTTTCAGEYFTHTQIKKVGDKYVVASLDDILFYTNTADSKTTIQSTTNNEYVQATAAKNISYTEDEYKWANDGEKLTAATASHGTLQYNTNSPRFTTYTTKVGQYATIVDLSNVIVSTGDASISIASACTDGETCYSTYSNASAFVVPEGLTVSTVGVDSEGKLVVNSYNTGDVVAANTGVMVSGAAGDHVVTLTNATATDAPGTNNLHPSSEEMTGDNLFYRLTMHNGTQIGFWWGAENGAAFNLAANKAYLAVPSSASNKLNFWFGDGITTGIEAIENDNDNAIFNLQGQRMNRVQKGVNIVNGRKVIR